jgi:hypothetical protein
MKPKININYILAGCVVVLSLLCVLSVLKPLNFQKEQAQREVIVKKRLLKIRTAEERYRQKYKTYTGSFSTLIRQGFLADSLQYIPFAGKKRFDLQATVQLGKSGRQIPLMECGADYHDYLSGMDSDEIEQLIEKANTAGQYPGLKFGDIETDNNNEVNW